jgi:hypothetical protein
MKCAFRGGITIVLREARVGGKHSGERQRSTEAISAKNVLCVVFLGESSSAGGHVTFNFTAQICLDGTVSGAVETSE